MILQYCSKTMLGGHENIFLSTKSINSHLIFLDVKWKYLASNTVATGAVLVQIAAVYTCIVISVLILYLSWS